MSVRKILLLVVLLLAVTPFFLFAQSSGKIVGTVKDKSSGEPLPGVNISLEGTQLGAATDVDGFYVILNVPVGVYTIRANFIGYSDVLLEGVRVSADKTTEANFMLQEAAIEGQAVIVTAQKPLVEKYTTQSVQFVTSEDLENIPVRGFNALVSTQNSVVLQDGQLHIRGGRTEEVGYYLDGASSINPVNNTQAVYVIQEAVEEFQVLAGGYNAEFGGANSGIIRTELRTGSSNYNLSLDFQTDKFADEGSQFLSTYSYRDHILVATLGGPLIPGNEKIRFFAAFENNKEGDRQKRFSTGYQFDNLVDTRLNRPVDDTVSISYLDGFTPRNDRKRNALNGTLLFDLSPLTLRVSGVFSDQSFGIDDQPMLSVLNSRTLKEDASNYLLTLKGTYIVNPKTILEASLSTFNSDRERSDGLLGNRWELWYDSAAVSQATGGAVTYRSRYTPQPDYLLNGFDFERDGTPAGIGTRRYLIEKTSYLGGALNFTSQMGRYHEVKFGGDFRQYKTRFFSIAPNAINILASDPNWKQITDVPQDVFGRAGRVNNYGYDNYGREVDGDVSIGDSIFIEGPKKPLFLAFYAQDKIEYRDLIINAGVRLDYFDTDDKTLINPSNPKIHSSTGYILPESYKEVDPYVEVSPRLGFSFPVSERTVFYSQYGKFIQVSELNDIYFGSSTVRDQAVLGGNFFLSPIGFGLEPIRTTSYEIGFRQQLSSVAAFNLTGFYRNIKGQTKLIRQSIDPDAQVSGEYNRIVNGDFATTQGLELGITLRRTNRIQAQINYTFTDAEGTGSDETTYLSAVEQARTVPTTVKPLDFAQRHRGSIFVDYRFGKNDGGPILQQLGVNALFTFNSGHPYTLVKTSGIGQVSPYDAGVDYMLDSRTRLALEPLNSSTTPWNFNIDLRVDKNIKVTDRLSATLYARINNLLNTRNVINVYQRTGSAEDDGFLSNPDLSASFISSNGEQQYIDLYRAINLENGQAYWDVLGKQLWGNPRQIFFGIKFNY